MACAHSSSHVFHCSSICFIPPLLCFIPSLFCFIPPHFLFHFSCLSSLKCRLSSQTFLFSSLTLFLPHSKHVHISGSSAQGGSTGAAADTERAPAQGHSPYEPFPFLFLYLLPIIWWAWAWDHLPPVSTWLSWFRWKIWSATTSFSCSYAKRNICISSVSHLIKCCML